MPNYMPNKHKITQLKEKVFSNFKNLLSMQYEKKFAESQLINMIENVKWEEKREFLKGISIDEFKNQFPDINPFILKKKGIENVYELSQALSRSNYSIPGINLAYLDDLKNHLNILDLSINKKYYLRFNPEEKNNKKEKILKLIFEIDVKDSFYKYIDIEVDRWKDELYKKKSYLKTNIFWNLTWFFKSSKRKKEILKAIDIYKKFLSEVNLEKIKKKEENLNKKINDIDIWEDFKLNSSKYYAILEKICGEVINQDVLSGDLNSQLIKEVNKIELNQKYLKVTLRSWQEFGAKFTLKQKKVLIGDEMGLGKTVEALAVIADLKFKGKKYFLVVCPASIIINWYREVKKHTMLKPIKLHGKYRDVAMEEWLEEGGVGISSYSTVQKLKFPKNIDIDLLVLDEAHYVKNENTKRSQFAYKLTEHSQYVMYMTGTPIENNLQEMLNLIEKLNKEIILELENNPINYTEEFFKETIGPVYLRRNRRDVLRELPELVQMEEWVEFSAIEKKDYIKNIKAANFMGMRSSGFAGKTRSKSPKINRILELVEEYTANGNKVVIFSFFRKVLDYLERELGDLCVGQIKGGVSQKERVRILDEFEKSKNRNVLVAQIEAAGLGLNMQYANTIIICEPQLKPSTETQAISRAYRMGQINKVFVHRILTQDSIDEMLMELLDTKQYVFDTYAKKSDIGIKSLKNKIEEEKVIKIQEYILNKEREKYKDII